METRRTVSLVGTAILSALVVVFDYTLKFSGWKIPFPWSTFLKFDLTGIPIVLSMLLYGLRVGGMTSAVAFLAIVVRSSGDFVGASMKALAEFATILGMAPFVRRIGGIEKAISFILGLVVRIAVMSLANLVVLPAAWGWEFTAAVLFLPLLGVFNAMQGLLSISGGYLIYEAIARRVPTLAKPYEKLQTPTESKKRQT